MSISAQKGQNVDVVDFGTVITTLTKRQKLLISFKNPHFGALLSYNIVNKTVLLKRDSIRMCAMQQLERPVDWYDAVCQRLDLLRQECVTDAHDGNCCTPPEWLFEAAKKSVEDLRRLAGFPAKLPVADVWLGPERQIGLTWEFSEDKSIDLIFAPNVLAIRFTDDLKQYTIEPKNLPTLLAKLAA